MADRAPGSCRELDDNVPQPPTDGDEVRLEAYNTVKSFYLSGAAELSLPATLSIDSRKHIHDYAEGV